MLSYGSRKFIITIGCELISSILVFCKSIESSDYRSITIAIIGLYTLGNVAQKALAKDDAKPEA